MTAPGRAAVLGGFGPVRALLAAGELDAAAEAVREASARIDGEVRRGAELKRRGAEVLELRVELARVGMEVHPAVSPRAAVRRWVEETDAGLGALLAEVAEDRFAGNDALLQARIASEREGVRRLAALVGEVAGVEGDVERLDRAYREARPGAPGISALLANRYLNEARSELGAVASRAGCERAVERVGALRGLLGNGPEAVETLREHGDEVNRAARRLGRSMSASRRVLTAVWAELESGRVPPLERVRAIRRAIREEAGEPVEEDALVVMVGRAPEPAGEGEAPVPAVQGAREVAAPVRPVPALWRRVVPVGEPDVAETLLYAACLAGLTVVGYVAIRTQPAVATPGSVAVTCLALFLWGFGVQTAAAALAGGLGHLRR